MPKLVGSALVQYALFIDHLSGICVVVGHYQSNPAQYIRKDLLAGNSPSTKVIVRDEIALLKSILESPTADIRIPFVDKENVCIERHQPNQLLSLKLPRVRALVQPYVDIRRQCPLVEKLFEEGPVNGAVRNWQVRPLPYLPN